MLERTRVVWSLLQLPPTSPQTHPSAWPFMEPVKKSEAPDYYEIIRFPIGRLLCPVPQDRITEEGAEDPPFIVGSVLGTQVWGGGSLGIAQSERGMSWDPWLVSGWGVQRPGEGS